MRNHCINLVEASIKENKTLKSCFLTGDLGYSVLDNLQKMLGENFLNVGIAEANMMSIAAALAFEGRKLFTYSIVPFTTFRCLEQIRNDICYHNCDVTIIGVGVGYGYGCLGPTHHAIDDIGALIAIPNLSIYSPNDNRELSLIFNEIWTSKTPKYLRLGKGGESVSILPEPKYIDGAFIYGKKNPKLTIFVIGTLLTEIANALDIQKIKDGLITIISLARLKTNPDTSLITEYCSQNIFFVQESSVSNMIASQFYREISQARRTFINFELITAPDKFASKVGSQQFQRTEFGLDARSIANKINHFFSNN